MSLRRVLYLGFVGVLLLLLSGDDASYAQAKPAATPITVYQDPG
jgi:hypothetical protein